jgi:glycosyltransferase involved in cell wall biosynthesis
MEDPKVSILLPVFNAERYLYRSLDSVLEQTYGDYELLLCDDASTDDSVKIVESRHDPRIRFFRNRTNRGLFKTINMLIKEARGTYIKLWSQDDIMKPQCLAEERAFHEEHPEIGFSYCLYDTIDDAGEVLKHPGADETPEIIPPPLADQLMFYYGSIVGNISNVMIRKAVLDDVGLFREDMHVANDFEMWVRITKKYPIGFIRQILILLRFHEDQLSRRKVNTTVFMREDYKIIQTLLGRLPPDVRAYAKTYERWHRRRLYFHYMVRSIMAGDLDVAGDIYRIIKSADNPLIVFLIWLATANGKLYRKKPLFVR